MSNSPLLSVIILSYNRKEEVLKCIRSVLQQGYDNVEIVVLDNNSSDGSVEAIRNNFRDVNLLRMPKNYGDWEGRDIALSNCHGKYTVIIDNDAVLGENVLQRLVGRMEREPKLAVVEPRVEDPDTGSPFSCSPSVASTTHYRANFLGCTALFRTKVLRKAGGFPHYLLGGAELHLVFRFIDLGYRVLHIGDAVVYHEKSSKERIPHRRLFLQTKQKIKAIASHLPWPTRACLDTLWKSAYYLYLAAKAGYVTNGPPNTVRLLMAGIRARRRSTWIVKKETVNVMDFLNINIVKSVDEYKSIPSNESHFIRNVRRKALKT